MESRWALQRRWLNMLRRPHEAEFNALSRLLPTNPRCLDLGANRGQSIDSIRQVMGVADITAFEPIALLALRLAERYPDVRVIQRGVGACAERVTLYIPHYRGARFDPLAATDPEL